MTKAAGVKHVQHKARSTPPHTHRYLLLLSSLALLGVGLAAGAHVREDVEAPKENNHCEGVEHHHPAEKVRPALVLGQGEADKRLRRNAEELHELQLGQVGLPPRLDLHARGDGVSNGRVKVSTERSEKGEKSESEERQRGG